MKKAVESVKALVPFLLASLLLSSCASLGRIIRSDYSVPIQESYESVKAKADKIMAQKSYMKRFSAVDKFDKRHDVVILDYQYFTIDGVLYAYQFNNMMYYGPALSFGKSNSFALPDKAVGFQGYASVVANPSSTVSFIFARKLFGQKGYSSMYEACKINGVSFAGRPSDAGYFDDFGKWHEYGYHDYFENVFKTRKQDVPLEMYQALQKR